MNEERFRELARQAGVLIDWGEDIKVGRWGISGNYKNMQKFAELIVRECAEIADTERSNSVGCGYITKTNGMRIKEHFGVEE